MNEIGERALAPEAIHYDHPHAAAKRTYTFHEQEGGWRLFNFHPPHAACPHWL